MMEHDHVVRSETSPACLRLEESQSMKRDANCSFPHWQKQVLLFTITLEGTQYSNTGSASNDYGAQGPETSYTLRSKSPSQ